MWLAANPSQTRSCSRRCDRARIGPPQQRLDPQRQLAHLERLGHVVVGADLQPLDAVGVGAARGEEDDGDVLGLGRAAERAADLEPRVVGQHEIEQHQVGGLPLAQAQGFGTEAGRVDPEPLLRELVGEQLTQIGIVFDDQNAPHGGTLSASKLAV
jgi:hypothetical protein